MWREIHYGQHPDSIPGNGACTKKDRGKDEQPTRKDPACGETEQRSSDTGFDGQDHKGEAMSQVAFGDPWPDDPPDKTDQSKPRNEPAGLSRPPHLILFCKQREEPDGRRGGKT